MIKAVIFDLDGTLADTLDSIKHGVNLAMERHGFPFNTRNDIKAHINRGARELIRRSVPKEFQTDEKTIDEVFHTYNETYKSVFLEVDKLYDGMNDVINKLSDAKIKMSVLSNKQDYMVAGLCKKLLPIASFTEFRGQREGAPTKPNPTVPLEICELMGIPPFECALVGDSDIDMITAKNAGFTAIGVSWGYRTPEILIENGADFTAYTPDDIVKIILGDKSEK